MSAARSAGGGHALVHGGSSAGLLSRICSRDLLEFIIRRRVAALSGVDLLERRDVVGLLAYADRSAVSGLRLRARRSAAEIHAAEESLAGDFVVDASGRSSRAPQWLVELGYAAPAETNVNSFLKYVSRQYQPPDPPEVDWKGIIVRGRGHEYQYRGGGIYPIEAGRWIVTLAGPGRDHPPLDDAGFTAFTETLADPPLLAQALRRAVPLGPTVGYQQTDNRWRHYERLARWPDSFVVLGDAACAFNPIYGQGMTVAGLDALALDAAFRRAGGPGRPGLAQQFQKTLARSLTTPWLLATSEDYRVPQTEGPRPSPALRLMHAYVDLVTRASTRSVRVFTAYTEVSHLLRPPAALFHPAVAAGALWPSAPINKTPPPP
jgi:2-polyprenyl-6-methoxyphenol hydroxylase-like FAD-dependent oxidoreductase